jgi:predicted permease
VAISFVLLCSAAVLVRSFIATQRADIGISRKPLLTVWLSSGDVPREAVRTAVERVRGLPGVTRAAAAIRAPLSRSGDGMAQPVFLPHRPPGPGEALPDVKFTAVSEEYFATMGVRLVRGRLFTEEDQRPGDGVIVVNERFAREYFPGTDPVGARVRLGSASAPDHRIIGVVGNAVISTIGEQPEPYFYLPYWRGRWGDLTLLVESAQDPATLAKPIRAALMGVDSRLEPRRTVTMPEYIRYSSSTYQATAALGAALGFIGLVLTALGVYGVVAYQTARRTREIGIRVALGAARSHVLRLVLHDGLKLVALGLAVGVPAAMVGTRLIASMLFGTNPWDVPAFVAAAGVLVAAVCAATLVPARRAVRVSPSTALRDA